MAAKRLFFILSAILLAIGIFYFIRNQRSQGVPATVEKKVPKATRRLFPAAHEGRWGYIDETGKLVIQPAYSYAMEFHDGYAQVQIGDKWGYIDEEGKMVIQPQFEEADRFAGGLARVVVDSRTTANPGYIDTSGKIVVRAGNAQYLGTFSEGFAVINVNGKFGYIDTTGKMVIQPEYDIATSFASGLARVGMKAGDEYRWGYIDKTGKVVLPLQYDDASDFSEGLAGVRVGELAGYIDPSGNFVIPPQFEYAGDFKEGLAPFFRIKFGYIDKAGKVVIPPQFDLGYPFSGGLARVLMDHGSGPFMGFIDATGKFVIEAEFDSGGDFANGFAPVMLGDQLGYIDRNGKYLWHPCASCNVTAAKGSQP